MKTNLVYDVGAHNGSDTEYYLSLGHDVLAIEADPTLAAHLRQRFSREIADGKVQVLQCGVTQTDGTLPFYVCPGLTIWNSFSPGWATSRGMAVVEVQVPTRRFESILAEYRAPFFLKVDIEGLDGLCIKAIERKHAPKFVSFEANSDAFDLVLHLHGMGYKRFAMVDQYTLRDVAIPQIGTDAHMKWAATQRARRFSRQHAWAARLIKPTRPRRKGGRAQAEFRNGGAGPTPMLRRSGWQPIEEFSYTWTSLLGAGLLETSWYDVHVALEDECAA